MAINSIAPPSAAPYSFLSRTNGPEQTATPAASAAATTGASSATTPAAMTDVAGTVGMLSPSVLAALMGQDVKLLGSLAGG